MNKRKTYFVCGKKYDCEWVKDRRMAHPDGDASASLDYDNNKIKVFDNGREDDLLELLLHEVIHGISDELALGIDESRTAAVATALSDFLMRNGMLK